jgi:hypothetical protein
MISLPPLFILPLPLLYFHIFSSLLLLLPLSLTNMHLKKSPLVCLALTNHSSHLKSNLKKVNGPNLKLSSENPEPLPTKQNSKIKPN